VYQRQTGAQTGVQLATSLDEFGRNVTSEGDPKSLLKRGFSPADAANIADPAIRQMILQRIDAIASDEPYDATQHGYFLVIVEGDTLQAINAQIGFDLLAKPYEILEEYPDCYDLLYIVSDDGFGVELFIPKNVDIDPDLLLMCQLQAVPGAI
jgi:hypothetical protein